MALCFQWLFPQTYQSIRQQEQAQLQNQVASELQVLRQELQLARELQENRQQGQGGTQQPTQQPTQAVQSQPEAEPQQGQWTQADQQLWEVQQELQDLKKFMDQGVSSGSSQYKLTQALASMLEKVSCMESRTSQNFGAGPDTLRHLDQYGQGGQWLMTHHHAKSAAHMLVQGISSYGQAKASADRRWLPSLLVNSNSNNNNNSRQ